MQANAEVPGGGQFEGVGAGLGQRGESQVQASVGDAAVHCAQSASSGGTTCVEVAFIDRGIVALRDSKNPHKPPHLFDDAEYDAFTAGIMRGELRRP
ncbi:DUF397 domain-containing protein [Kitasatospora sp. NPDC088556]|uniref:DUF397 domain-containing protein n=1 Tax=Kitasatospora sp. NPDC088556 TaxID=3364076 RepID=UPI00380A5D61